MPKRTKTEEEVLAHKARQKAYAAKWYQNHKLECAIRAATWYQANKDKVNRELRERYLANHAANKEKARLARNAWRRRRGVAQRKVQTSESLAEWRAAYYAKNRERLLQRAREYRAKTKAAQKRYAKRWRQTHPETCKMLARRSQQARRARLNGVQIDDLRAISAWEQAWRHALVVQCAYCYDLFAPRQCHAEHVVPLSRGGPHALNNLVIACAGCNLSKHAKTPAEWRQGN